MKEKKKIHLQNDNCGNLVSNNCYDDTNNRLTNGSGSTSPEPDPDPNPGCGSGTGSGCPPTEPNPDKPTEPGGSGSGGIPTGPDGRPLSERELACVGKKYGDVCFWKDKNGVEQQGYCVYPKLNIHGGPLFCAKRDYKKEDNTKNYNED